MSSRPRWMVNEDDALIADAVHILLHRLHATNAVRILPIRLHSHATNTQPDNKSVYATCDLCEAVGMEYTDVIEFAHGIHPVLVGVTEKGVHYVKGIGRI